LEKKKVIVKIDIKGISDRIVALPVAQKSYSGLQVAEDESLYYIQWNQPGSSIEANGQPTNMSELIRFDFKEKKAEEVLKEIAGFNLSADGKVILTISEEGTLKTAEIAEKMEAKALNTVGKQVTLMVSCTGKKKDAKKVIVEPISNERNLRFWSWVEGNRKAVEKASKGKVGYVYLLKPIKKR